MKLLADVRDLSLRCYNFIYDVFLLFFTSFAFQYDIEKGLLLKLDSFLQIQLGKCFVVKVLLSTFVLLVV